MTGTMASVCSVRTDIVVPFHLYPCEIKAAQHAQQPTLPLSKTAASPKYIH